MIKRLDSKLLFAVAMAVILALPVSVQAASRWWDGGTSDIVGDGDSASAGGVGTWSTTITNWDAGVVPHTNWINANNDIAFFAGTVGTVSLGAAGVTVGGLQFDTTAYTITGNTLTFGMSGNIVANQDATINSAIAATGLTITKTGGGTLTLGGNNTYAGNTTVSVGTLKAGSITALSANSAFSVSSGAILDLGGFNNTIKSLSTATGTITNSTGNATLTISTMATTAQLFTGSLALKWSGNQATTTLLSNSGNTFSGGITVSGVNTRFYLGNVTIGAGTPGALTGGIWGTGALTLGVTTTDTPDITFTGAATINNAIIVNSALGNTDAAGTFRTDSSGNILNGTLTANLANVTFRNNGGTGGVTINGAISGNFGVTLSPSAGTGLTITMSNTGTANSYLGATVISSVKETLTLGAANQIPNGASAGNVTNNGTFNLGGFSETINGLSGTGTVDGVSGTPTLTVGDNNATSAFSGVIKNTSGTLSLTKIGSGALTLSGTNTYGGATTVSVGMLKAGSTLGLSSNSAFSVAAGTTLDLGGFTNTIKSLAADTASSIITNSTGAAMLKITTILGSAAQQLFTGSLGLQVYGGGNVFGNSNNTYSGGTIIGNGLGGATRWLGSGTIGIGSPGALTKGYFGTGPITIGAATSDQSQFYFSGGATINNAIVVNSKAGDGIYLGAFRNEGGAVVINGTINANLADVMFEANSGGGRTFSVTNTIFGTSGLTVLAQNAGGLTVTLANTGTANSYAGNTTISSTNVSSPSAILTLGAAEQIPHGPGKGNLVMTNGTFNLGGFSETINGLSGTGIVDGASSGTPTPTLTVGDNDASGASNTFYGVIKNSFGTLSLTKIGAGTLTLSGTNTYNGTTTVSNGTLMAGSNFIISTNSAVTVVGGATFTNNTLQAIGSLAGAGNIVLGAGAALSNGFNNTSTIFGGIISGSGLLAKYGTGVLSLTNDNTYSGNTTINAGKLQFVVGGSCSNSSVFLAAATATNSVSVTDPAKSWTCSNLTASAAGVLEFNFVSVTPSTIVSPLNIISNATFSFIPSVSVLVSSSLAAGTYP